MAVISRLAVVAFSVSLFRAEQMVKQADTLLIKVPSGTNGLSSLTTRFCPKLYVYLTTNRLGRVDCRKTSPNIGKPGVCGESAIIVIIMRTFV